MWINGNPPKATIGGEEMSKNTLIFYTFKGGSLPDKYCCGYLTGGEEDLICVKPCNTNQDAEAHLSPIASCRVLAITGFALKWLLSRFDENMIIWSKPSYDSAS